MTPVESREIIYNDRIARQFLWASVAFGVVGMLVGALIALQMAFWKANLAPYLTFGRLRPLHTNAVIFAFVGNMLFAGVYYSTQRLLKARIASDKLASIHFWGWQAIVVAAAITLPLGYTQGKEYAELEWPIDLAIAAIWVVFAVNFFWTIKRRNEKHLYVALWFYIATIVTVAVLHIVNSLAIPFGPLRSYSLFGGVQDALVQWWYGHNAVAFFLTTPVLGIMYYFVPKAAERPVFSYRLSIIHFWALVFLYIWAGPHHLLYTALPDWAQTLGMLFSLMLWAPSWGGMLNGLLTLRGVWNRLRTDPVLKFFAAGVTFYGMATFEGPLLSIKSVNGLAHYTDWIIGHVHSGGLGWNGFMAAGMFYWLVPRLYNTKLHSRAAADLHFYVGTVGILLYVISMWVSGVTQGLMWRAKAEGGGLMYPSFIETVLALKPMYWTRLVGGTLYLLGFVGMAWNLLQTARSGAASDGKVTVVVDQPQTERVPAYRLLLGSPIYLSLIVGGLLALVAVTDGVGSISLIALAFAVALVGIIAIRLSGRGVKETWHRLIEGRALIFTTLVIAAVLIGGVAEIVPTIVGSPKGSTAGPYSALEVEGREIYLREGCYTCHSQMIRPFLWETARYGAVSNDVDSAYDHPFQWGSKRTGPDLARVGGKYSDIWHYEHMLDPRKITPGSNMPAYPHLLSQKVRFEETTAKLRALRAAGVPYSTAKLISAPSDAQSAAEKISQRLLKEAKVSVPADSELVALIAYLQRLGKAEPEPEPVASIQTPAGGRND